MSKDWSRTESIFQAFKCFLTFWGPVELNILPSQVNERLNNSRKTFDEPSIEVGESKERANIFDVTKNFSFLNGRYLFRIHFDTFCTDDQPKVTHLCLEEFAFSCFEVDSCFFKLFKNLSNMFFVFFLGV